jgi:hypothetical protein
MCKEILLCVLAHAIDETPLLNTGSSGSLVFKPARLKVLVTMVSQVADRCAPAEEAARVAVVIRRKRAALFGKGAVN